MQRVCTQDRRPAERLAEGQGTDAASAAADAADIKDLSSVARQLVTL